MPGKSNPGTRFNRPRTALLLCLVIICGAAWAVAQGQDPGGGPGRTDASGRREPPRGPQGGFLTEVPAHMLDIIAGRPMATSITLSVLCHENVRACVAYGVQGENHGLRTGVIDFKKGSPQEVVLENLRPGTEYSYQLRNAAGDGILPDGTGRFHTRRAPGEPFLFTLQADSHLDENTAPGIYRQALANILADAPDFHLDLGDTFMTGKHSGRESAAGQYLAQRYYLGLVGRSSPIFLVLGNHDGEEAGLSRVGADPLAVWSNSMRKRYFPNPVADGFYSGDRTGDSLGGFLEDYYAWEWGDALFIALNPYWYSSGDKGHNWNMTLGRRQYDWLKTTLEKSRAKFKFVFIHQLVGGLGRDGRGGTEAAGFFEWGGKNADGSDGFKQNRPGWELPIHELLVRNHVTIVFHGHDHLFARQTLDGTVYQEVPQPGFKGGDYPKQAAEYGYKDGVILGGSGYLRVKVYPGKVTVDYVKSSTGSPVIHSYTIPSN